MREIIDAAALREMLLCANAALEENKQKINELNVFPVPDGDTGTNIIGTRHGEKLYETLVTREEMAKAVDMGDYYRIPCDTRDLNYDKFFTEGNEDIARIEDYHSHNTARLDVEGMKKLLLKLRFIREDLGMEEKAKSAEIKSE